MIVLPSVWALNTHLLGRQQRRLRGIEGVLGMTEFFLGNHAGGCQGLPHAEVGAGFFRFHLPQTHIGGESLGIGKQPPSGANRLQ